METKGTSPFPQQPITGTYSGPDKAYAHSHSISLKSILIHPSLILLKTLN
jgi:hypothetical protein